MSIKEIYYDTFTNNLVFVPRSDIANVNPVTLPVDAFVAGSSVRGMVIPGMIQFWIPGFFTSSANTGYAFVYGAADTVAAANAFLNPMGYWVCDGSAVNDPESPIWNTAGRYLPNISDNRFIQGFTAIGGTSQGGSNVLTDHTHVTTNISTVISHTHANCAVYGGYVGNNDGCHSHTQSYWRNAGSGSGGAGSIATYSSGSYVSPNPSTMGTYNSTSSGHNHGFTLCATGQSLSSCNSPSVTGTAGTGSAPNLTDNRPQYLKAFAVIRVK